MILEIDGAGSFSLITRRTIECDITLSNLLRASGAERALIDALTAGEEPDAKIFEAVSGSGKLFDILAAALVPEGVDALDWSPTLAQDTARKLKHVTSDAGKRALVLCVVPLVTSFFLAGLHSLTTSPSYSPTQAVAQPDSGNAATMISATGASWSASWRSSILGALWRLSGGLYGRP